MNTPIEPKPKPPVAQRIKRGVWILALILVLVFIVQNIQTVSLNYWFWGFTWPLALLIIVTLIVGMLLGWGLTRIVGRRRQAR